MPSRMLFKVVNGEPVAVMDWNAAGESSPLYDLEVTSQKTRWAPQSLIALYEATEIWSGGPDGSEGIETRWDGEVGFAIPRSFVVERLPDSVAGAGQAST